MECRSGKSRNRATLQLVLAILGAFSWGFIVLVPSFFDYNTWYFITRLGCILSAFWLINLLIAIEVLLLPMQKYYLLWRINRELFNFTFNFCMGLVLVGYTIYLVILWFPDEESDEFFGVEISFFERTYEIYILMLGVGMSMMVGCCGISYGIVCMCFYRYYFKRKGEKGGASNVGTLNDFFVEQE